MEVCFINLRSNLTPSKLTLRIHYHRRPKWRHSMHADEITFKGRGVTEFLKEKSTGVK